ncbi:WD_REPEATS_REGION domain-containing protein, partial [Trichonephila clavipes]
LRDTNEFLLQKTLIGPENVSVTCISAHEFDKSKPKLLASYASGDTILWDVKEGTQLLSLKHERQTLVNTFNTDSSCFAISGSDAKIQLHDTESGREIEVLQGTFIHWDIGPGAQRGRDTDKLDLAEFMRPFLYPTVPKGPIDFMRLGPEMSLRYPTTLGTVIFQSA